MTQNNLGNAYSDLGKLANTAENLEKAIAAYREALRFRTPQEYPQDYAATQNNLGTAYWNLGKLANTAENLEKAIAAYRTALTIYLPQTSPLDCLLTSKNLGNLSFRQGNWELAIEGYKLAVTAVEQSRDWAKTDARRQEIIAESIGVYENIIQACVNLKDYGQALEYADRARSKHLVDLMHSHDLYPDGDIPEEVQQLLDEYETLQTQINEKQERITDGSDTQKTDKQPSESQLPAMTRKNYDRLTDNIDELQRAQRQVWEQLRRHDMVLAESKQVNPLSLEQMQQLLENEKTALLSFYTTTEETFIFILYGNQETQCYRCPEQGRGNLQNWLIENWINSYARSRQEWQENMKSVLAELSQRLHLNDLTDKYLQGIEELIIVPHFVLHQIPFAALPLSAPSSPAPTEEREEVLCAQGTLKTTVNTAPDSTEYLGDKFRIRLVPSCQILNYCHQRHPSNTNGEPDLGIVEDATEDLPFTPFECESLAQTYQVPTQRHLRGKAATLSQYKALLQQVGRLHSSHHAAFDWENPLNSKLILADGDLTLGTLLTLGWRIPDVEDVFTCCCEVNFTTPNLTDDPLTLAAGFLCAGARAIITTQWAVSDLGSALLSIFYYQNRKLSMTRSAALQQAQRDLRKLTGAQLQERYEAVLLGYLRDRYGEESTRFAQLERGLADLYQQESPFADPYYWAGFVVQGMA
ncbi:CHAT domain-containing protein [Roseofilum casamattae]|uniref:CHAT domain-containing protein n=1 Tax=Roseofilum casamattae BLCC-M143 TaxID=3022442 RepID=A0ABT7C3B8_9CYAN|nr:CHAT domain-containing protein [Roseofilum casamattae]MDJ1185795.1 CHAT domain-containing protein [Roseofilum casamattae BLCC-M143]